MTSVLLDSDILIEVSRLRNREILGAWERLRDSDAVLMCSPVTIAEIWHGARLQEHGILDALFSIMVVFPVDVTVGRRAGEYLRRYSASHGVELGDALIAATARLSGASLWTRNRKHYPMRDIEFYS